MGHDKGDLLLESVARRLLACVREQDTVARLGGDEFVLMVEGLNRHGGDAADQPGDPEQRCQEFRETHPTREESEGAAEVEQSEEAGDVAEDHADLQRLGEARVPPAHVVHAAPLSLFERRNVSRARPAKS